MGKHPLTLLILLFYIRPLSFCEAGVQSKKHPRPQSKKEQTFYISLLSRQWGSKPCHTCDFLYWNAFLGPYVLQDWNLTKSFQSISLKSSAELLRLHCIGRVYRRGWCGPACVCVCVVQCLPFLFSHTMVFIARAREKRVVLLVFIRRLLNVFFYFFFAWVLIPVTQFTSQLLCLCSERRDIKPRLQFAQWQTTQKACLPPWHLTGGGDTLGWEGECNYSNEI